jgi:hypothetical protein
MVRFDVFASRSVHLWPPLGMARYRLQRVNERRQMSLRNEQSRLPVADNFRDTRVSRRDHR